MNLVTEEGKKLIGTTCECCKRGTLKKKYNRQVKPAKAFIGCTNYPRCTNSFEINGEKQVFSWEGFDYEDSHPHSSVGLGQY